MVMSENIGSVNWLMRIVTGVVTQDDGLVRNVTVKTSKGLVRRDVRKLCLLVWMIGSHLVFSYFVNLVIILLNPGSCFILIRISGI